MVDKAVVEGNLTYHYCAFKSGLDGFKIDGEWIGEVVFDNLLEDGEVLKEHPDDDMRYSFTIPYGKVRITVERLEDV